MVPVTPIGRAFTALLNVLSLGVAGLWISEISEGRHSWIRSVFRLSSAKTSLLQDFLLQMTLVIPPLFAASLAFTYLEGWGFLESVYFTLTCTTGLGMGDVEPLQPSSRVLFSLYLLWVMGSCMVCLQTLGMLLSKFAARSLPVAGLFGGGPKTGQSEE